MKIKYFRKRWIHSDGDVNTLPDDSGVMDRIPKPSGVFVLPYALVVPLFVVMIQSVYVWMAGWHFQHNALITHLSAPIISCSLGVMPLISFFIIRSFAASVVGCRVVMGSCIAVFTTAIFLFLPRLS